MSNASITDFAKGTVLSEGIAEIVRSEIIMWDYNGYRPENESPALHITYEFNDEEVSDEFYTLGPTTDFAPTEDGKAVKLIGGRTKIHQQSNFAHYILALIEAGFPKNNLNGDDLGCLVGTKGHVTTVTIKRIGKDIKDTSQVEFDRVDTIPGKANDKPKSKAPSEEVSVYAELILTEILETNSGSIAKKSILVNAMKTDTLKDLKKSDKTATINLLKNDDFLSASDVWNYEGGFITMA